MKKELEDLQEMVERLQQAGVEHVALKANGWIEVHSSHRDGFLRVVREDEYFWHLYHLDRHEALAGDASFSNTFVPALVGVVVQFLGQQ
jgi:imidazoleglycerol phosphate synthase glutamine amidotransferase subunit HisH